MLKLGHFSVKQRVQTRVLSCAEERASTLAESGVMMMHFRIYLLSVIQDQHSASYLHGFTARKLSKS